MTGQTPARRGRAPKRTAIEDAARRVFGREGYARTSIDTIATEAGVSTRTIYNHFEGKQELFSQVLESSARRVAEGFEEAVARTVSSVPNRSSLVDDLEAIGRAVVAHRAENPDHFAMVRQIGVESGHFPAPMLRTWQEAGPLRVRQEISRRLRQLTELGLLRLADPYRAAAHFVALVMVDVNPVGGADLDLGEARVAELVAEGVHAFLDGYRARPGSPGPR